MFESVESWSLPSHLYLVSEWSATCSVPNDASSCQNDLGQSARRCARPTAQGEPGQARLSRGRTSRGCFMPTTSAGRTTSAPGTSQTATTTRNVRSAATETATIRRSGIRCRISMTSTKNDQVGNVRGPEQLLYRRRQRHPPVRVMGRPDGHGQRAPAWPDQRRPDIRHAFDQHGHVVATVVEYRDLPGLGRLGWLLRPRRPTHGRRRGYGLRVPALVISPYAKSGLVDHQTLSFDAYMKFIEDDFLQGQRLDPTTDGRPDPRPDVRENDPALGDLRSDFDFTQSPRAPVVLPEQPQTDLQ